MGRGRNRFWKYNNSYGDFVDPRHRVEPVFAKKQNKTLHSAGPKTKTEKQNRTTNRKKNKNRRKNNKMDRHDAGGPVFSVRPVAVE